VWAWKWVYQEPVGLSGIPGTHNYACKQADDSALTCDDDDDGDCRRRIAQKGYLPSLPTHLSHHILFHPIHPFSKSSTQLVENKLPKFLEAFS